MARKQAKTVGNSSEVAENEGNSLKTPPESVDSALFKSSTLSRRPGSPQQETYLSKMSVPELIELRGQIDSLLPPRKLSDVDIEEELLLQFAQTKVLYSHVIENQETPANQRAQVANSCTAILEQLIKMQTRLYSAERVKAVEQATIRVMREMGEEVQARFFEIYERALEALSGGA